jgi:UrcA family protein
MTRTLTMMAATVAALLASPGPARPRDIALDRQAVVLKHLDSHPATPGAARRTLARLDRAALDVCGASQGSLVELKRAIRASACWRESMDDVLSRIDDPRLRDAYTHSSGKRTDHGL